jgi:hypothetical protein
MRRSTFRSRASGALVAFGLGAALVVPMALVPAAGAQQAPASPVGTPGAEGEVLSWALDRMASAPAAATTSRSGAQVQSQLADLDMPSKGADSIMVRDDGRLVVNVDVADTGTATLDAIAAAGARVTTVADEYQKVSAEVAVGDLEALAATPGVLAVTEVRTPMTAANAAPVQEAPAAEAPPAATNAVCANPTGLKSEGDTQLSVAAARTASSVDGTGVKVGVLSDTYNRLGGATTDVSNAELPGTTNPCDNLTPVEVLDPGPTSDVIDEGRAMLQIVHDLAPESPLAFSSAFNSDLDFANEIRALEGAGARVIVDDVSYYNEPFYQDGPIAKAVNDVTALGVTYFSSAGNSTPSSVPTGGSYESGAFRGTGSTCPSAIVAFNAAYTACHDFDSGGAVDNGNTMTIPNNRSLVATLGWNEPMYGVTTNLDLFLVSGTNGVILAGSIGVNVNTKSPIEIIGWDNTTGSAQGVSLVVARRGGSGTPRFKTIVHRNPATSVQWNGSTVGGGDVAGPTIFGHNAALKGASVAAVPYNNANTVESFSSRGPTTYCWQPVNGTSPSAVMACQTKNLDIAATDGTKNSFFGSFDGAFWRFYGTSASAPHAAAIAALQVQKRPCRTPAQILAAQRSSAATFGSFTVADYGSGRVTATTAITNLAACPPLAAAGFHPLTPSRILDSRTTTGGWNGKLAAGSPRVLQVTGLAGSDIPGNASAVVMNVTATESNNASFLKVWPTGSLHPNSSNLNFGTNQTIPNLVTVKLGTGGTVRLATAVGQTHVVADVVGYFDNGSGPGDRFTGIGPVRILDSRGDNGGWNGVPIAAGNHRDLVVRGRGGVPAGATAVIANVTVVGSSAESFLRVWPSGGTEPGVSNLNFRAGQIIPNLVMVMLGPDGNIRFRTAAGSTHVVVDVVGYFDPSSGAKFTAVDPTRILDSRVGNGLSGPWGPGQTRPLSVAGAAGTNVPSGATGIIANFTVADATAPSLITVFPDTASLPSSSNLNFTAGQVIPNLVAVRLPANGRVSIYNDQGTVSVIADVVGYFK